MALSPDVIRQQISLGRKELHKLAVQKHKIEQEMNDWRDLIRANANFLPDEERHFQLILLDLFQVPETITEVVKFVLLLDSIADGGGVTPVQVKNISDALGFDLSEYTNVMASIHTILKRMLTQDPPLAEYNSETETYKGIPDNIGDSVYSNAAITTIKENALVETINSLTDVDKARAVVMQIIRREVGKRFQGTVREQ